MRNFIYSNYSIRRKWYNNFAQINASQIEILRGKNCAESVTNRQILHSFWVAYLSFKIYDVLLELVRIFKFSKISQKMAYSHGGGHRFKSCSDHHLCFAFLPKSENSNVAKQSVRNLRPANKSRSTQGLRALFSNESPRTALFLTYPSSTLMLLLIAKIYRWWGLLL